MSELEAHKQALHARKTELERLIVSNSVQLFKHHNDDNRALEKQALGVLLTNVEELLEIRARLAVLK